MNKHSAKCIQFPAIEMGTSSYCLFWNTCIQYWDELKKARKQGPHDGFTVFTHFITRATTVNKFPRVGRTVVGVVCHHDALVRLLDPVFGRAFPEAQNLCRLAPRHVRQEAALRCSNRVQECFDSDVTSILLSYQNTKAIRFTYPSFALVSVNRLCLAFHAALRTSGKQIEAPL